MDSRYFAAAPTRGQAKRIFWKDLKRLIPDTWIKKIYETDLCITTKFGSELWVVGLDKPQRIEGVGWDGGVLDEYADMKGGLWAENVRPSLSDKDGWCWLIGVPNGLNHFKELADYASSGGDADWGFYSWPSSEILPPEEIESVKRTLDSKTFRQEYEASFESASGRVYYAYRRDTHEDASITLNPKLPIILCCDFNVDPCVWELVQSDGYLVKVFDEVALRDTNTVEMAREVKRRYGGHRGGFIVYGDAAGASRSTTGKSDYVLLKELGFKDQRIARANPQVKDRVNAMNTLLLNSKGEVRLTHHPVCGYLRKDLEGITWSDSGEGIDKRDGLRTHASDAIGYYVDKEYSLIKKRLNTSKRFYK